LADAVEAATVLAKATKKFSHCLVAPAVNGRLEHSLSQITLTVVHQERAAVSRTRSSRLYSSRRSLCRALICIAIETIMMTKEMTKTAIAVRSAINFASDNGIGACVARNIPNQLAPTSAKKRDTRSHPSNSRLIRRRCRQDFFAAASSASSWSVKCVPRRLNVPRRTNGCLNSFRSGPLDN
jgi:hypothetical protein